MRSLEGYDKIKVLGARLVIKPTPVEELTQSGLIINPSTQEPKYEGTIVAVGPGARLDNGNLMPMDCSPGDKVIYSRLAGVPITYQNEELLIINERDIIGILM